MYRPGLISACLAAAASLLAGGCTGTSPLVLPTLPELAAALSLSHSEVAGSPTEAYARIARGAMACWFGSNGPLKADYVYHAQAEPASKGGKSTIVIHQRDRAAENQRGMQAFRVAIEPQGSTAFVKVENLKLGEPLAGSMEKDARRWAAGAIGCEEAEREWVPEGPSPDPGTWKPSAKKGRET